MAERAQRRNWRKGKGKVKEEKKIKGKGGERKERNGAGKKGKEQTAVYLIMNSTHHAVASGIEFYVPQQP